MKKKKNKTKIPCPFLENFMCQSICWWHLSTLIFPCFWFWDAWGFFFDMGHACVRFCKRVKLTKVHCNPAADYISLHHTYRRGCGRGVLEIRLWRSELQCSLTLHIIVCLKSYSLIYWRGHKEAVYYVLALWNIGLFSVSCKWFWFLFIYFFDFLIFLRWTRRLYSFVVLCISKYEVHVGSYLLEVYYYNNAVLKYCTLWM